MDLNYCLSQRRRARTALRNYILLNAEDIEKEFKITIPKNLKNMSGATFVSWFQCYSSRFLLRRYGEENDEFVNLIREFECANTNVFIAEKEMNVMI